MTTEDSLKRMFAKTDELGLKEAMGCTDSTHDLNDMLGYLVRDFTKVGPMSKSSARRRLLEWEAVIRKDEREKMLEEFGGKTTYTPNATMDPADFFGIINEAKRIARKDEREKMMDLLEELVNGKRDVLSLKDEWYSEIENTGRSIRKGPFAQALQNGRDAACVVLLKRLKSME
jgi:hypothetical protein